MSFYKYDLKEDDALIMGHLSPDADCLCSSIAIAKHLISQGKKAYIFLPNHPKNLAFLVDENKDLIITTPKHPFCQSVKLLYVVDCEPSPNRTGFPIDLNRHFVYNIDHHIHRIRETFPDVTTSSPVIRMGNPNHTTHLELAGSTCSILVNSFRLKNDVLALGIIKDTLGLQYWGLESAQAISQVDITNERLQYLVTQTAVQGSKKEWDAFKNVKVYWDNDSQICVAYDPTYKLDSQHLVSVLSNYCSAIIYYHKSGNISLKTSLDDLDLAKFATRMGGGGHRGAAGFKSTNIKLADIINSLRKELNLVALNEVEQYELSTFERQVHDYLNR